VTLMPALRLVVGVCLLVSLAGIAMPAAFAAEPAAPAAPASTSTTTTTKVTLTTLTTTSTTVALTTTTKPSTTTTTIPPATTTTTPTTTTSSKSSTAPGPATTTTAPSTAAGGVRTTPTSVGPSLLPTSTTATPSPAQTTGPSSTRTVGSTPAAQSGRTGDFTRILRLLESQAVGPERDNDGLARAEQNLARLRSDLEAALRHVEAANAVQQRAQDEVKAIWDAMRRVEDILARPSVTSLPVRQAGATPTLTTLARQATRATEDLRAIALVQLVRLDVQREWRLEALDQASQSAAAAGEAHAAKAAEVETASRVLDDLRRQLWSKLADPSFASVARILTTGADGRQVGPSPLANATVPPASLDLYRRAAATCRGLSWTVLAAIGSIESDHGRSTAAGVRSGANFAGAMGPMQFLAETWAAYGIDGDGDGQRDVYNAVDAVHGAANYLCARGAGTLARLAEAIWDYNHAGWYVDDVLVLALRYGADGLATGPGTPTADVAALLGQPNLVLTAEARGDLAAGIVDARLVRTLAALASNHRIAVSVIKTGHDMFVAGTDRVSNHYHGRGVDIYAVDGAEVASSNSAALQMSLAILTSSPELRPDEFGSPWSELSTFPGAFSDAGHQGHLHLGWGVATP
jgi:molybdenum-dependent DNA-binding transcriptional regulator ModE